MSARDIFAKYPIRNPQWSFNELTGRWIAFAAEWEHSDCLDPWNRILPLIKWRDLWDTKHEEIIGWIYETTVAGNVVECVVFND
jgi:hypothetical protein